MQDLGGHVILACIVLGASCYEDDFLLVANRKTGVAVVALRVGGTRPPQVAEPAVQDVPVAVPGVPVTAKLRETETLAITLGPRSGGLKMS